MPDPIPPTIPDPADLSDEGLLAAATVVANLRLGFSTAHATAATDASAWVIDALEALADTLAPHLRSRIEARVDSGVDDLLAGVDQLLDDEARP